MRPTENSGIIQPCEYRSSDQAALVSAWCRTGEAYLSKGEPGSSNSGPQKAVIQWIHYSDATNGGDANGCSRQVATTAVQSLIKFPTIPAAGCGPESTTDEY